MPQTKFEVSIFSGTGSYNHQFPAARLNELPLISVCQFCLGQSSDKLLRKQDLPEISAAHSPPTVTLRKSRSTANWLKSSGLRISLSKSGAPPSLRYRGCGLPPLEPTDLRFELACLTCWILASMDLGPHESPGSCCGPSSCPRNGPTTGSPWHRCPSCPRRPSGPSAFHPQTTPRRFRAYQKHPKRCTVWNRFG